jgi:outer membrane protein assembly factor BamB
MATLAPQLATGAGAANGADWPTFGGDNSRSNANMAPTKITPANVGSMVRMQVKVSAPIDAGLIYLKGVQVNGASRDVFFGTTNLGRTVAIDANEGKVLWEYASPDFDEAAANTSTAPPGGRIAVRQISNSTPVADDNRQFIYAAGADGKVTKISIADGKAVWSTAITKAPKTEKMDSPLSFVNGKVVVPTAGYVGDQPPYQGHIAVLDAKTGALEKVWNSLCSDRAELMDPTTCEQNQSAIWGRAGIVHDPATGNLLFATGNGPYDGKTAWGDTLIMLDPTASKMLGNWTTTNNEELNRRDLDMGSTTPALLGDGYMVQGGKDAKLRLLSMDIIKGAQPNQGKELQILDVPGKQQMLTAPATAKIDGKTYLFVSTPRGGTAAWTFADRKLTEAWSSPTGGNTPFYAGGMLFIYSTGQAPKLNVLNATTGEVVASLDCSTGHWNSPIVVDDRIALPEGAISGFGGFGGGGRRGGGPAAAPAADEIPAGIVNIWHLP